MDCMGTERACEKAVGEVTLKPEFRGSSSSFGNTSSVVLGNHFTSTGGVRQESLRKAEKMQNGSCIGIFF